jgi:glycosyltransferase involved in cell wall biosynthesis
MRGWRWRPDTHPAFPNLLVFASNRSWPRVEHPRGLDAWLFARRVRAARAALQDRGCRTIIIALWFPSFDRARAAAPFDLSCYFIDDEYTWSETEHDVPDAERAVMERVDQVFIHSPALLDKKGAINPNTLSAPNGVDYAAYVTAQPVPADLAAVPRPRIGYAGVLKTELDWSLLASLAERHDDWSFVFVGPKKPSQAARLADESRDVFARTNVYWLGAKPVTALPAYQQHFDVAILPYRRNAYTRYIYPLKLHESLAAGPPVVGARLRTLEEFTHVVHLAESVDEWSGALSAALREPVRDEARARRQQVACEHDWNRLVDRIAATLLARL